MMRRSFLIALLLLAMNFGQRPCEAEPVFPGAVGFGTETRAGTEGHVIRVTTLESEGPGSLREALSAEGERLVVFDVGGVIDLNRQSITISHPHVTVAGQTAPSPGITLIKGGIFVPTHDVLIQHLRIRPGDADQPKKSGWEVDGLTTAGGDAYNIVVDHCSFSWATDENLSASGPRTEGPEATSHRITFSNNIIAECLYDSSHAKGPHSKGTLIHDYCTDIAIIGNLYAHNHQRSPYFKAFTTGVIVNNVIYNPGSVAIQLGFHPPEWKGLDVDPQNCRLSIVGNVLRHGQNTSRRLAMISRPGDVFMDDNLAFDQRGEPATLTDRNVNRLDAIPFWPEGLIAVPSGDLIEHMIKNVGARPWDRDATDARILREMAEGKGRIIDSQIEVGGYPSPDPAFRAIKVPDTNRREWLAGLASKD